MKLVGLLFLTYLHILQGEVYFGAVVESGNGDVKGLSAIVGGHAIGIGNLGDFFSLVVFEYIDGKNLFFPI